MRGGNGYGMGEGKLRWDRYGTDLGTTSRSLGGSVSNQGRVEPGHQLRPAAPLHDRRHLPDALPGNDGRQQLHAPEPVRRHQHHGSGHQRHHRQPALVLQHDGPVHGAQELELHRGLFLQPAMERQVRLQPARPVGRQAHRCEHRSSQPSRGRGPRRDRLQARNHFHPAQSDQLQDGHGQAGGELGGRESPPDRELLRVVLPRREQQACPGRTRSRPRSARPEPAWPEARPSRSTS